MNTVRLSVIIPSVGRSEALFNTVTALLPQLFSDEAIIVVDQNQPALTWPEALAGDTRLHIAHLRRAGLTRARNVGLKIARQSFAVFLDDDIVPAPSLLAHLREAAARRPDAVWTGTVTQADVPIEPANVRLGEETGVGFVDLFSGQIVTDFTHPPSGEVPFFAGGLCLLPLHITGRRHLYARAFRGAAQGEEIDLALRLRKRGVAILSDPNIRMHHLKVPTGGCRSDAFRQRFAHDEVFNRGYFWGRHGRWPGIFAWYRRQRGFIEFHARKRASEGMTHPGHDWRAAISLGLQALWGVMRGAATRPFL